MLSVTLADATRTSRLLTRVLTDAVEQLSLTRAAPPFSARLPLIVTGTADTLDRVMGADELGSNKPYLRLTTIAGLEVRVDPTAPPGQIRVVDPRTFRFVPIEVR